MNSLSNGETFKLVANPNAGHDFVNWSDGFTEISSESFLSLSFEADTYSIYKAKFNNNLDNTIEEFKDALEVEGEVDSILDGSDALDNALGTAEDEVDNILDGGDELDNALDTVEDEIDNILDGSEIDNSLDALEDAATNIEDEIDDLLSSDNIEDEVNEKIESLEVVYMFGSKPEKGGARFLNTDSVSIGIFEGDTYSPISDEEEVENNIFLSGVVAGYGTVDPSDYLDKVIWMRVFNNMGDTFYIRDTSWPKFQNVTIDEYGRLGRDFSINGNTVPSDIVISPLGNQGVNIITNDGINGEGLSLNFSGVVAGLDNALVDALMASRDAAIAERDAAIAEREAAILERDAAIAERDARPTLESYNALQAESASKHSLEEIRDLRPGSKMIRVIDNKVNLSMVIEESDDLNSWNEGSTMSMEIPVEEGSNAKFYRFKMNDSESESSDGYANSVFSIVEGSYTWEEATVDAESRGGRLAVIKSSEVNDRLKAQLNNMFLPYLWIGLYNENGWKWVYGPELTFSNWDLGEPNGGSSQKYAHIWGDDNLVDYDTTARPKYSWNDVYLSYIPGLGGLQGYLLEIPQNISE